MFASLSIERILVLDFANCWADWSSGSLASVNVVVPGALRKVAIVVGALDGVMTAGAFGPIVSTSLDPPKQVGL